MFCILYLIYRQTDRQNRKKYVPMPRHGAVALHYHPTMLKPQGEQANHTAPSMQCISTTKQKQKQRLKIYF